MPTDEPGVRDVVLFESVQHIDHADTYSHPPIIGRVDIGSDLYIQRLPGELNRMIMNACMYRGHNWPLANPIPTLYAFVRDVAVGDVSGESRWDDDQRLQKAVALSRLCHPTSIALEHAARVFAPGVRHRTEYVVQPSLVAGHGNQAFIAEDGSRNWLTEADVADLPAMIQALPSMPARVKRALWMHEYAARTAQWEVRFPIAVTGIDALTNTEKFKSTRQFRVGVTGLAQDVGATFADDDALKAYECRSKYVHGQERTQTGVDILIAVETILRKALKRALVDPSYASIFATEPNIRAKFPLT